MRVGLQSGMLLEPPCQMFMMPNMIAVGLALLFGLIVFKTVQAAQAPSDRRFRAALPLVALIAGPVLAAAFCAIDKFVLNPGPWAWTDLRAELPSILCIGAIAGVMGAVALWVFAKR